MNESRISCCLLSGAAWTVSFLLLLSPVSAQIVNKHNPFCKAVFDFYFALDSSGSVNENFHSQIVPFVSNMTRHYTDPNFRVSFVTFASDAVIHLNLTRIGDRASIEQGLRQLQLFSPGGGTILAPGLTKINEQIADFGGDTASVLLVLTDGFIFDQTAALEQAEISRSLGGSVVAIGVGDSNREQLVQISGNERRVYIGSDFEFLSQIIDAVVNETCVEIQSVTPPRVCVGSTETITLHGRGFTNKLLPGKAACRFKTGQGLTYETKPEGDVLYDVMSCPVPQFNHTDIVVLEITTNGISFISSNVSMEITSQCQVDTAAVAGGVFGGILAVAIIVALVLLWFFCPLLTCTVIRDAPPERRKAPPRPRPPKSGPTSKWEVVDASYYGGRGAGGISPMTVKWGGKGATAEGSKLEKAKGATVVKVETRRGRPPPRPLNPLQRTKTQPSGCCAVTKGRLVHWYSTVASYRPVYIQQGSTRKIVWSPHARQPQTSRDSIDLKKSAVSSHHSEDSKV